jgi:beta-phosphoglucomutase-like phosphatase (HAD superfamily)
VTQPGRRFDAVLYDMDGVLVDSEPWWNESRVEYASSVGREWTPVDQALCMGGNSREWAEIMRERLGLDGVDSRSIQDAVVAGVVRRYQERPAPIIDDAPRHVRRIARERPVAIASSSHPAVIDAAVGALGLREVMGAIVSSDEVAQGKPAPDVYLMAASRLGVAPARCLVVEDSINGVRAGRAAGATVVIIPSHSVPAPPEAHDIADAVVPSLTALDPDALAEALARPV